MKYCSTENCQTKIYALKLCSRHYQRFKKHGDANVTKLPRHGGDGTPEYSVWIEIRRRCRDSLRPNYKDYGGRGIKVCERWEKSFAYFREDMGLRPSPDHQIDRIDNDGDYEPANCRWATAKVQANNRRSNHWLTAFGREKTVQEWCEEFNLADTTLHNRLRRGWDVERALQTPPIKKRTHCKRGHEFTPENTYIARDSSQNCRTCKALSKKKRLSLI